MIKRRILIIGQLSPPVTGVTICNDKIIEKLQDDFSINFINTADTNFSEKVGTFSFYKLFHTSKQYLSLYKIINTDITYITIGQTFFGVIKYLPFLLLSKLLYKKTIIHIHGNYLSTQYNLLKGIKRYFFKKTIQLADKGIVLSESLRHNLLPFLQNKNIHILYNFVDEELLRVSQEEIKSKDFINLKILYLSNLMTEKGILDLLKSLEISQNRNVEFQVKLAGNIDDKIKDEIIYRISLIKNIEYLGVVKGKEKRNLLLESNIFVFPTYYKMEGQPISLLEAMAMGNIILTTKHAGILDIVSNKNGIFIDKHSPKDISLKLEKLSHSIEEYKEMSIHNYNYVKSTYSEKTFLSSLKEIFNS